MIGGSSIPWDRSASTTAATNRRLPVPKTRRASSLGTTYQGCRQFRGASVHCRPRLMRSSSLPHHSPVGSSQDELHAPGGLSLLGRHRPDRPPGRPTPPITLFSPYRSVRPEAVHLPHGESHQIELEHFNGTSSPVRDWADGPRHRSARRKGRAWHERRPRPATCRKSRQSSRGAAPRGRLRAPHGPRRA